MTDPRDPSPPVPAEPPAERRPKRDVPFLALLAVVVPVGLAAVLLAQSMDRLDSALLFVGTPLALALLVGAFPSRSTSGTVFQVITIVLLLASAFLHEGALCVLIASPLVYGTAFFAIWVVRLVEPSHRYALTPLLLLIAMEGVLPGMRVNPDQQVSADHVVAADCTEFEAALVRGPQFEPEDRGWLLDLAQYPTPLTATHDAPRGTDGLGVGDTWTLTMPAGAITTEVTAHDTRRITFDVVEDSARTQRWATLKDATLSWEQTGAGCEATVRIDFTRHLDPSFYFGPVTSAFMTAGAEAFVRGLA